MPPPNPHPSSNQNLIEALQEVVLHQARHLAQHLWDIGGTPKGHLSDFRPEHLRSVVADTLRRSFGDYVVTEFPYAYLAKKQREWANQRSAIYAAGDDGAEVLVEVTLGGPLVAEINSPRSFLYHTLGNLAKLAAMQWTKPHSRIFLGAWQCEDREQPRPHTDAGEDPAAIGWTANWINSGWEGGAGKPDPSCLVDDQPPIGVVLDRLVRVFDKLGAHYTNPTPHDTGGGLHTRVLVARF